LTRRRNFRAKAANAPWPPLIKMDKTSERKLARCQEGNCENKSLVAAKLLRRHKKTPLTRGVTPVDNRQGLGSLLFRTQFTDLANSPGLIALLSGFVNRSQVGNAMTRPRDALKFVAAWSDSLEQAGLAVKQLTQVIARYSFIHFQHFSHLLSSP